MDEALLHVGAGGILAVIILKQVFKFLDGKLATLLEKQTELVEELIKEKRNERE